MSDPRPPSRRPRPEALIAIGVVFLACGVVFLNSFETFIGATAASAMMVAGGLLLGVGVSRVLRARRGGPS